MTKYWWIYRVYGRRNLLLYIGMSSNPEIRFEQHECDKAWARQAVRWVVGNRFECEWTALAAEAEAIMGERPLFNIEHNEGNPDRVNPHTMRYASGVRRGEPYRPDLYSDVHAGEWTPGVAKVYRSGRRGRPVSPRRDRRPARWAPPVRRRRRALALTWLVMTVIFASWVNLTLAAIGSALTLAGVTMISRSIFRR